MISFRGAGAIATAALIVSAAAFWPTTRQLLDLWLDFDRPYSHGLLVAPISIWLVARVCRDAWFEPSSRSLSALLLFIGATVCWIAAYSVDIVIGQQMLLPTLLIFAVATAAGWVVARRLAFPIGFIYFAVPIWAAATESLQAITVAVVGVVLEVVSIPLYVEGNLIAIPEGVFEVAGGCAGLHFFIVALTISSLHGYLYLTAFGSRLKLITLAALMALLTNWFRVGSLVAVGHYTDMQHYLIKEEHYYYGWGLFAIALVPVLFVARRLAQIDASLFTNTDGRATSRGVNWAWRDTAIVAALSVAVLLPLTVVRGDHADQSVPIVTVDAPEGGGGWQIASLAGPSAWEPSFDGADAEFLASYLRGDARVDVYFAVYRSQEQGRELIGERNRFFTANDRSISMRSVAVTGLPQIDTVREQIALSPSGVQRVVWYWYAIGDRFVADDLAAKLWQAIGRLRGRDSGAVVAISVTCATDCAKAEETLHPFLLAMGEPLVTTSLAYQDGSVH